MSYTREHVISSFEKFLQQRVFVYHPHPEVIRSALDLLKAQEWISVEEQLPGPYECVLIATDAVNAAGEEFVSIGALTYGVWECFTGRLGEKEKVTHWMPLPKPPEVKA